MLLFVQTAGFRQLSTSQIKNEEPLQLPVLSHLYLAINKISMTSCTQQAAVSP